MVELRKNMLSHTHQFHHHDAQDGGSAGRPERFDWPVAYAAENLIRAQLGLFLERNQLARVLAERMREESGTDIFEWIDHVVLPPECEATLLQAGFAPDPKTETPAAGRVFEHPCATLPRVLLPPAKSQTPVCLTLRPEFVADFVARHNLITSIEGEPFSRFRRVVVSQENGARLEAVERRAYRGFIPAPLAAGELRAILLAKELWKTRPRRFAEDAQGFRAAEQLLDRSLELVGSDLSCQFFFEAERAYWEDRNLAARLQKRRQDQLGLGWGNHDHHTFRCSRTHFLDLVNFLTRVGFIKRERFYAGAEAGWGAQVLEQPVAGIVVFADVDLLPDETRIDFSSARLSPAPRPGTVGLWVGLHGESFLEAGLHHLEARFDFDRLRDQLGRLGVQTMKPFSNFEFLRQAFTEGERWSVQHDRADRLLAQRLITPGQHARFLAEGALGSHLENLQRHGGFKGFNQRSVSAIITATDPRKTPAVQAA